MSGVFVQGMGSVSPAGWGVEPLMLALKGEAKILQTTSYEAKFGGLTQAYLVPPPEPRPSILGHPRLRRASPISHFAAGAVQEALNGLKPENGAPPRLGLVLGLHTGCLRYSERFYGEVCQAPSTASPMLFPETVMNAPASHIATCLGNVAMASTVIGDQTAFIQALLMACGWLNEGKVDHCLVVSAEESGWPTAVGVRQFSKSCIPAEGAGALLLGAHGADSARVALTMITDAHTYAGQKTKDASAMAMRREFPVANEADLLVDGRCGIARIDAAETKAWSDWPGQRCSPRVALGEGLSAATAWQCIAAIQALGERRAKGANVSVVGCNQQAIGLRFEPGN